MLSKQKKKLEGVSEETILDSLVRMTLDQERESENKEKCSCRKMEECQDGRVRLEMIVVRETRTEDAVIENGDIVE